MSELMRLDRFLVSCGTGSRTEVKKLLKMKAVSVNGMPALRPELKIDPDRDEICCQGKPVRWSPLEYLVLNKPAGCVTALKDDRYPTVMQYLDAAHAADPDRPLPMQRALAPVGRLDADTEGLLLFTNDGALAHRLLAPGRHVSKVYLAQVDGALDGADVEAFQNGLEIGEKKPTLPARLEILSCTEREDGTALSLARLTICEGKFHQVKRMFLARGKRVLSLKREAFGPLVLEETLPCGQWRWLTEPERKALAIEGTREGAPGMGN